MIIRFANACRSSINLIKIPLPIIVKHIFTQSSKRSFAANQLLNIGYTANIPCVATSWNIIGNFPFITE